MLETTGDGLAALDLSGECFEQVAHADGRAHHLVDVDAELEILHAAVGHDFTVFVGDGEFFVGRGVIDDHGNSPG